MAPTASAASAALDIGKGDFSRAQAVHGGVAAARDTLRFGVDQKQCDAVLAALIAREARRHDELVGGIAMDGEALLAVEHIARAVFLRRRRDVGEIVARLPL